MEMSRFDDLEKRVDDLEAKWNRKNVYVSDQEARRVIMNEFGEDDDVMVKDMEAAMSGIPVAAYRRAIRALKADGSLRMEKFGVNWAFHRCGDDDE